MSIQFLLPHAEALADFLHCTAADLRLEAQRGDHVSQFSVGPPPMGLREYIIGTEAQVELLLREEIRESVWAFTPAFLASFCALPEKVFTRLQESCEDSNSAVLALIEKSGSFEDFVQLASATDGRGHFLSPYDGQEHKTVYEGQEFFIYRIN